MSSRGAPLRDLPRLWRQFLRFVVVGAIATALQFLILSACVEFLGWDPVPASGLGFALSACLNYVLNRRFTFESTVAHRRAVLRFGVIVVSALGWNLLLMLLFTRTLGFNYLPAQVCTTGLVLVWSFCGNALWSFAAIKD